MLPPLFLTGSLLVLSETHLKTEIPNSANAGMDKDPSKSDVLEESKEQDSWGTGLL